MFSGLVVVVAVRSSRLAGDDKQCFEFSVVLKKNQIRETQLAYSFKGRNYARLISYSISICVSPAHSAYIWLLLLQMTSNAKALLVWISMDTLSGVVRRPLMNESQ